MKVQCISTCKCDKVVLGETYEAIGGIDDVFTITDNKTFIAQLHKSKFKIVEEENKQ